MLAFACLLFSWSIFLWQFITNEADPAHYNPLPVIGPDPWVTLGVVIFNFAFVVAVPSLLESTPGVDVKRCNCNAF